MPISLPFVETSDEYTEACTVDLNKQIGSIQFAIQNNAVFAQVGKLDFAGQPYWDDFEAPFFPGAGGYSSKCYGIRFRSAVAGSPAEVAVTAYFADDPVPFSSPGPGNAAPAANLDVTDGITDVNPTSQILVGSGLNLSNPSPGVAEIAAVGIGTEHNDIPVSVQQILDVEDTLTVTWVITDDPVHGRVKLAASVFGSGATATMLIPAVLDMPDSNSYGYPAWTGNNGFANAQRLVPAFTKSQDGVWYGSVRIPPNYNSGGSLILSCAANATTGTVRFIVGDTVVAVNVSEDTNYTTETAQNIAVPGTAKRRFDITFPLTTTLVANSDLNFFIKRNGANVADTLAVDCLLWFAGLSYTGNT